MFSAFQNLPSWHLISATCRTLLWDCITVLSCTFFNHLWHWNVTPNKKETRRCDSRLFPTPSFTILTLTLPSPPMSPSALKLLFIGPNYLRKQNIKFRIGICFGNRGHKSYLVNSPIFCEIYRFLYCNSFPFPSVLFTSL